MCPSNHKDAKYSLSAASFGTVFPTGSGKQAGGRAGALRWILRAGGNGCRAVRLTLWGAVPSSPAWEVLPEHPEGGPATRPAGRRLSAPGKLQTGQHLPGCRVLRAEGQLLLMAVPEGTSCQDRMFQPRCTQRAKAARCLGEAAVEGGEGDNSARPRLAGSREGSEDAPLAFRGAMGPSLAPHLPARGGGPSELPAGTCPGGDQELEWRGLGKRASLLPRPTPHTCVC